MPPPTDAEAFVFANLKGFSREFEIRVKEQ